MRKHRLQYRLLPAVVLLVILVSVVHGDFVRTNRESTIKAGPNGDAQILSRPDIGDEFVLTESDQTNGYYHVRLPDGGIRWGYFTLASMRMRKRASHP
jgi:hypothetical protein